MLILFLGGVLRFAFPAYWFGIHTHALGDFMLGAGIVLDLMYVISYIGGKIKDGIE